MIQANEYRLGNLITPLVGTSEHIGEITSINKNYIGYDLIDDNYEEYLSISHESTLTTVKPIPLTEEILFKFGFEKMYDKSYYYGNFILNDKFIMMDIDITVKLDYTHQLQNLYFALTGQELTFKN